MAKIFKAANAKQSFCSEQKKIASETIKQLDNIKNVIEERDDLKRKLDQAQEELEQLKRIVVLDKQQNTISRQDGDKKESENQRLLVDLDLNYHQINTLENDIDQLIEQMETSQIEPEMVREKFESLKSHYSNLSAVQKQNNQLKTLIYEYEKIFGILGFKEYTPLEIQKLKHKIDRLNDTIRERDILKNKVNKLEKQLCYYSYLPEEIETFKQRSSLLDDVLADRDRLSKKVEELRGLDQEVNVLRKRADRVTELEDNLLRMRKDRSLMEAEMNDIRERFSELEIENYNKQAESDTLRSKLVCMEHEMESLKYISDEKEYLILERDHLRDNLDELIRMQGDFDGMKEYMKQLEVFKAERDIFKSKYESLIGLECECDILRTQVEKAKTIEKERDALETRVGDLENCIIEQEAEIRSLVCHIDTLAKGREEEQEVYKDRLMQMREELEKKDSLIITAEEKLSSLQNDLKNSIEGLSCKSQQYKMKNEHLESIISSLQIEMHEMEVQNEELKSFVEEAQVENQKLVEHIVTLKGENENFVAHIKHISQNNVCLIQNLEEKEDSLNTLKEVLKDHEPILEEFEKSKLFNKHSFRDKYLETDSTYIRTELEHAKAENEQLRKQLTKLLSLLNEHTSCEFGNELKYTFEDKKLQKEREIECLFQSEPQRFKMLKPHTVGDTNKLDNFIVNYVISTGVNNNTQTWDCVRKKRKEQATQVANSVDVSSSADLEVESSSFIYPEKSNEPEIGTLTRDADRTNDIDPKSPPPLQQNLGRTRPQNLEKHTSVHGSVSDEFLGLRKKQSPDSRPRSKSGDNQWEYDISKWDCKQKYFLSTSIPEAEVKRITPSVSRRSVDPKDKVQYFHAVTQDKIERPITKTLLKCTAECQTRLVSPKVSVAEDIENIQEKIEDLEQKVKIEDLEQKAKIEDLEQKGKLEDLEPEAKIEDLEQKGKIEDLEPEAKIEDLEQKGKIGDFEPEAKIEDLEQKGKIGDLEPEAKIEDLEPEAKVEDLEPEVKIEDHDILAEQIIPTLRQHEAVLIHKVSPTEPVIQPDAQREKKVEVLSRDDISAISSVDGMEDVWFIPPAKASREIAEQDSDEKHIPTLRALQPETLKGKEPRDDTPLRVDKDQQEKRVPVETPKIVEKDTSRKQGPTQEDVELFYSPRDAAHGDCKEFEERIQILESELATANDTIYKLQGRVASGERLSAENKALRKHSIEVQDVAKDQIEDLVNHLKKAQLKIGALEDDNKKLNELNSNYEMENKRLQQLFKELQAENEELRKAIKQKDGKTYDDDIAKKPKIDSEKLKEKSGDKEKLISKELLTGNEKMSVLESEIADLNETISSLQDLNKNLEQKLKSCIEQNKALTDDLNKTKSQLQRLKDTQVDEKTLDDLRKQNENLLQKLDASNREVNILMEKVKTPALDGLPKKPEEKDKVALKPVITDLEDQLKALEPIKKLPVQRTDDTDNMIKELTKRLEDAEARSTKAESMLTNYKLSDSTAMLNDELKKCKAKIADLEAENKKLSELGNEIDRLRKQLQLSQNDNKTCSEENEKLKRRLKELEAEAMKSTAAVLEGSGDDMLKSEIKKLQDQISKLKSENSGLQNKAAQLDQALNKIDQLQKEVGELKRDSLRAANDLEKVKRELEKALETKTGDANKLDLLEREKTKNVTNVQNLEKELAKLKKELDACLNNSQESSSVISNQQEEINSLKKKISQLEGDKNKAKKELENAVAALNFANEKQEKKASETEKILQQYEQLLKENQRVVKENEKLIKDEELGKKEKSKTKSEPSDADKVLSGVKDKPAKVEPVISKTDDGLKDMVDKLKKQISLLEGENLKLKEEVAKGKEELKQLTKSQEKQKSLGDELGKKDAENVKLNTELNSALDNLQKTTAANKQNLDEIKKLKQKLNLLESENNQLKKDNDNLADGSKSSTAENNKLKASELALRQRLAQLESDNLKLKTDLDNLQTANKNNASKMEQLNSTVKRLEDENKNLRQNLDSTTKDLKTVDDAAIFKQKADQTEETLKKLRKELNDAISDHKNCPKIIAQLEDENAKLKKKIDDLEKENKKLKGQYEGAMGDSKKVESELKKVMDEDNKMKKLLSELEKKNSDLNKEILVMRAELGKLDSLLTKSKDEVATLKQKNASLEDSNIKLKDNLDSAIKEKDKLQKSYNDLKNENIKLKEKLAQLESENARLKRDLATSKKEVPIKEQLVPKQKLADLENENEKLKGELNSILDEAKLSATAKEHEVKLKQELAKLEKEHNKLKNELEAALAEAQTGNSQVSQLKNENKKLSQKISQLEGEIAKLRNDLNTALEEAKKGATNVSVAQESDAKLKQRIAKLEKDNKALNKDLESAQKQAKSGSDTTSNLRDENAKQKQAVVQLQDEIARLKEKLAAQEKAKKVPATDELQDLKKKLNLLEQQNSSLKQNLDGAYGDAKNSADENSRLIDENGKLKKQLQGLQSKLDSVQKDLVSCEDEKKKLNLNLANTKENEVALKKQVLELGKKNVDIKESLDVSRGDKKVATKVGEDNAQLKNELGQAQNDLKALQANYNKALSEINEKKNEINKYKDETALLKQKITGLEREIITLKNSLDDCLSKKYDLKDASDETIGKALREALAELNQVKAERDKFRILLEDQQRKGLTIKEKVGQVEEIISRERRKSKEEILKNSMLAEKLEVQEKRAKKLQDKVDDFRRKSEELENMNEELKKRSSILEEAKLSLKKESLILQEKLKEKLSSIKDPQKDPELSKKRTARKDDPKLKAETFKIVSVDGVMPSVIPITTPLSEKELKFFGKTTCTCAPNLLDIINKIAADGLEGLSIDELQFLHVKLADATAEQLAKAGQSSGILRTHENSKLGLLRRIAALEGDLLKKQKHAQQKVLAMQYAVKLEKERLQDLKKTLEDEKEKNRELVHRIESHTKIVETIREERDSIQRQKSYHEQKLDQYIITIEEERAKTRHLEDELEKEKSNVLHFKSLLESERDRARLNKRKDSEALERMRTKLEKTVNSETVLKMKLQDRNKTRNLSPCRPVKDTNHPMPSKSRSSFYSSSSEDKSLKAGSAKRFSYNLSTSRLD